MIFILSKGSRTVDEYLPASILIPAPGKISNVPSRGRALEGFATDDIEILVEFDIGEIALVRIDGRGILSRDIHGGKDHYSSIKSNGSRVFWIRSFKSTRKGHFLGVLKGDLGFSHHIEIPIEFDDPDIGMLFHSVFTDQSGGNAHHDIQIAIHLIFELRLGKILITLVCARFDLVQDLHVLIVS